MKIPSMGEIEIAHDNNGSISITQKDPMGEDDHVVYFPVQLAALIAEEILRLSKETTAIKD